MDAEVRRPRVARETRLLLTVALLAVVALWALSRLRYHQMFAPKIVERILKTAPAGADVTSWRY